MTAPGPQSAVDQQLAEFRERAMASAREWDGHQQSVRDGRLFFSPAMEKSALAYRNAEAAGAAGFQ